MPSDAVIEGVSGAAAGMLALVATYPLMTISTKQATRSRGTDVDGGGLKAATGALTDILEVLAGLQQLPLANCAKHDPTMPLLTCTSCLSKIQCPASMVLVNSAKACMCVIATTL